MPATFTGLVLLVVMLLPGLAYVAVRERGSSERRLSAFRESSMVVCASVLTDLTVLGVFAIVRATWPAGTPDVGRLVREGARYARMHYVPLTVWVVGLLALACLLAAVAAVAPEVAARVRRPAAVARVGSRWAAARRHPSTVSAWWMLFEGWYPGVIPRVGCILEDGSFIEGELASFNTSADDSADRDLVLCGPIRYRPPGAGDAQPYAAGAVCISARRITAMFVSHPPAETPVGPEAQGVQAPEQAAASASAHASPSRSYQAG